MTYSPALPAAMGYTVREDSTAGYGVMRLLVSRTGFGTIDHVQVWNPRDDSAQAMEIYCWLSKYHLLTDEGGVLEVKDGKNSRAGFLFDSTASLRAAIVEAAERVAQS